MSQEKITRFRRLVDSLYWQQFLLTAGMVLLTLLLLGVSFYALSYNDTVSERRSEMRQHAELIANMSGDYLASDGQTASPSLQNLIALAAGLTKADFLLCNDQGYALLTSDQRLGGQVVSVPQEIQDAVFGDKGFYQGRSSIGGAYDIRQFVVAVPVTQEDGGTVGMVLAVMDARSLMSMWRSFIGLFFMTSAIILLISFVASSLTSMRQIQPIREMVQATRSYAAGNFDVRMQDTGRSDEIGELAASFNNMADSLAETEHQRSEFIANISHELKTPMTTIAGYTDGILDGTIPPEKERKYLQIISDESRRLSRLVRRMLDISQIQSQQDMKKEDFDLCESMRLALLSMEQKITDRGLDVEADIPEDSVMVQGVNDLITQVIYNLLENAAKFAAPGSTLYLGLTETGGDKAVVTVRNTGHTIPAEEIPLLFERFHKSDKSRSEDKDGYGLGLYVVKTILSQHKEKITVTSENGVTSFSFTVQLAHPMPQNVWQQAAKKEKRRSRLWLWISLAVLAVKVAAVVLAAILGGSSGSGQHRPLPDGDGDNPSSIVDIFGSKATSIPRIQGDPGVRLACRDPQGQPLTAQEVYAKVNPSVVTVVSEQSEGASIGTGVIMTSDGYIITNAHVISGGKSCWVALDTGVTYEVNLVGFDEEEDLAVLKADPQNPLPAAEFGNSDLVHVGDTAYAIGNPLGVELRGTMTNGIISAVNRAVEVDGKTMTLLQTSAALNNGNSGGPLINEYGQVIGINTLKMSTTDSTEATVEGLGFALPISSVSFVVNDLIANGHYRGAPSLGITVTTVEKDGGGTQVQVMEVSAGSGAADAGIQAGDVILAADGQAVSVTSDLLTARRNHIIGDTVTLTILRDGQQFDVEVTLRSNRSFG